MFKMPVLYSIMPCCISCYIMLLAKLCPNPLDAAPVLDPLAIRRAHCSPLFGEVSTKGLEHWFVAWPSACGWKDDQSPRAHRIIKQHFFCGEVVGHTQLSKNWLQRAKPLQLCNEYHGNYWLVIYMIWDAMRCAGSQQSPMLLYHNANDKKVQLLRADSNL